jgi:hypothetical protein
MPFSGALWVYRRNIQAGRLCCEIGEWFFRFCVKKDKRFSVNIPIGWFEVIGA